MDIGYPLDIKSVLEAYLDGGRHLSCVPCRTLQITWRLKLWDRKRRALQAQERKCTCTNSLKRARTKTNGSVSIWLDVFSWIQVQKIWMVGKTKVLHWIYIRVGIVGKCTLVLRGCVVHFATGASTSLSFCFFGGMSTLSGDVKYKSCEHNISRKITNISNKTSRPST